MTEILIIDIPLTRIALLPILEKVVKGKIKVNCISNIKGSLQASIDANTHIISEVSLGGVNILNKLSECNMKDKHIALFSSKQNDFYLEQAKTLGFSTFISKEESEKGLEGLFKKFFSNPDFNNIDKYIPVELVDSLTMNDYNRLSTRERRVIELMNLGYSTQEIYKKMGITKKTLDSYTERIKNKLLENSTQVIRRKAIKFNNTYHIS